MKKSYQNPLLEVKIIDKQDILTASGGDNWVGWDPTNNEDDDPNFIEWETGNIPE